MLSDTQNLKGSAGLEPAATEAAGGRGNVASGKVQSASAANSLKHGLTATKTVPESLQLRIEEYRQELCEEVQPQTFRQRILVEEMARHSAAMKLCEELEASALRCGAKNAMAIPSESGEAAAPDRDDVLTSAGASQALERVSKYRRQHERGYFSAMYNLRIELNSEHDLVPADPPRHFDDEEDCEQHLLARREHAGWCCPRCGKKKGNWLPKSKRWECGCCVFQVGLRDGTIMERSPLPLRQWFAATIAVCSDLTIAASVLADVVGIQRLATVRKMRQSILEAIESPQRDRLLAGLQKFATSRPPEPSARRLRKAPNRKS